MLRLPLFCIPLSRLSAFAAASLMFALPLAASAHEHRTFTIGNKDYAVTIGSIGEPVRVDDKSGVEVMVEEPAADSANDDAPGTPVTGLEKTLKVEVSAGDQKKLFDLAPRWGEPGTYQAVFYPTVQTTYIYRLTGTINGVVFDIPFTCNPAGHPATPADETAVDISPGVTQLSKGGAFGCPQAKADVQFPEQGKTQVELASAVGRQSGMQTVSLALSAAALAIAVGAGARRRRGNRE